MTNLADLTIGVSSTLNKFEAGMRKIPAKAGEAADGVVSKFRSMAPQLEAVAKAGAVAAGAAIVVGATEGLEREALGDKLAAQLRLTEGESKVAGKIAGGLYSDAYGESLEQVNEAVGGIVGGNLAKLGDTEAVERLSRKALDLAATFDGDVSDGVARASALIDSGLAKDADEAFDLIIASSQKVAPALRDELGDATKEYSKHFADLGISGSDALGLLSSASDQFTLDKTGDAIKELSIRATDMSTATVDAFAQIAGIDVSKIDTSTEQGKQAMEALTTTAGEMSGRLLAGGETARGAFDQIVDGLLSIEDPTAQANAAIALFGTPVEDLGTAKIPDFLASLDDMGGGLGDVAGRADELGDTLNSNGKTRIEGFKRKFEGMLAKVTDAPGIFGDVAVAAGGIGTVLAPIGPQLSVAGIVFKDQLSSMASTAGSKIGGMVKTVVVGGGKMAATMVKTAATFVARYAFMAAQAAWNAARIAASWIIAMGPIAIAIALVVGLVAVVVKNWDTIKAVTGKVWDWISEKTSAVFGVIVDVVTSVWDRITGVISDAQETVKSIIGAAWDFVVGAVGRYVDLMLTIYVKIPQRIVSALGDLGGLLVQKGRDVIDGMRKGITAGWDLVSSWLRGVRVKIVEKLGDLGRLLLNAGKALMKGLLEGIKKGWDAVTGFVGGMAGKIADLKGPLPYDRKVLVDNGKALMFGLERGMQVGLGDVLATAGGIAGQIEGAIRPGGSALGMSVNGSGPGSSRGGLHIEHATFGDRAVVRDLDLWTRSQSAGV